MVIDHDGWDIIHNHLVWVGGSIHELMWWSLSRDWYDWWWQLFDEWLIIYPWMVDYTYIGWFMSHLSILLSTITGNYPSWLTGGNYSVDICRYCTGWFTSPFTQMVALFWKHLKSTKWLNKNGLKSLGMFSTYLSVVNSPVSIIPKRGDPTIEGDKHQ